MNLQYLMRKKIFTIFGLVAVITILYFCFDYNQAQALYQASDRISRSWPSATSSHIITFATTKIIPAGGIIVITPEPGDFFIPGGMDHTAVDLATSSSANGVYSDRLLAAVSSATDDGAAIISSTSLGSITITLNSTSGISAGNYVRIEIGRQATYQSSSTLEIVNPAVVGSHKLDIKTYDQTASYLERATVMVAIIEPVYTSTYVKLKRSSGAPNGWLAFGTTQTIMSIQTNYLGTCRYSTASGTPFDSMTDEFNTTGGYLHTHIISGFGNGSTYDYYIRCRNDSDMEVDQITECYYSTTSPWKTASGTPIEFLDCLDYWIQFSISSIPGAEGDETGAGGNKGGGGAGGGKGGGLGREIGRGTGSYLPFPPPPGSPGVVLEGYAYPNSDVVILKDGAEQGLALSSGQAEFGAFIEDLIQGIYTFSVWSTDTIGRKSVTYSTTFWIDEGTQTTVSNIFLPPTLSVANDSLSAGEPVQISGETAPGATVEVWMHPDQEDVSEDDIIKKDTIASTNGSWSMIISTSDLAKGVYKLKSKGFIEEVGESDFGHVLDIAIDESIDQGVCAGADLNGDGRVNITDFSILLYYWNTDDNCADQNDDGNVDLTDFSIMMFYWTG